MTPRLEPITPRRKWGPRGLVLLSMSLLVGVSASGRAEPGVSEHEVLFGQSAAFRGGSAALGGELWRGAQAYLDPLNASGGVAGRQVRIETLDDGYEPNRTLANTVDFLLKRQVFGLFGYVGTPTLTKALPLLQKLQPQGAFLFSDFTGAQPQREPPHDAYVLNVRASYREETAGLVDHLLAAGFHKIGVFIQGDAYGRSGSDGVSRALAAKGLPLAAEVTYVRGARVDQSMAAQVEILMQAGADAIVAVGSYQPCAAFIRDARAAGFNGPIADVSFVGADALLALLRSEGTRTGRDLTRKVINSQVVPPWTETALPLVAEYRRAMDSLKSSLPEPLRDPAYRPLRYSFTSLEGYLDAKLLALILTRAGTDLSRRSFMAAADSLQEADVGLGDTKATFTPTRHQALDKVYFTQIRGDEWITLANWKDL